MDDTKDTVMSCGEMMLRKPQSFDYAVKIQDGQDTFTAHCHRSVLEAHSALVCNSIRRSSTPLYFGITFRTHRGWIPAFLEVLQYFYHKDLRKITRPGEALQICAFLQAPECYHDIHAKFGSASPHRRNIPKAPLSGSDSKMRSTSRTCNTLRRRPAARRAPRQPKPAVVFTSDNESDTERGNDSDREDTTMKSTETVPSAGSCSDDTASAGTDGDHSDANTEPDFSMVVPNGRIADRTRNREAGIHTRSWYRKHRFARYQSLESIV